MTIVGKFELVTSDKYDDYLKAVGVGAVNRTLAGNAKPLMEYVDHGNGKWTQKTNTAIKNVDLTFVVGTQFDETLPDDRKSKSIITIDGNTWVHKQNIEGTDATTTRVFNDTGMTSTFTSGGVTAVRTFKKIA